MTVDAADTEDSAEASHASRVRGDGASLERAATQAELLAIALWGAGLVVVYALSSWRLSLVEFFPGPTGEALDFTKTIGGWQSVTRQYVAAVVASFALYGTVIALAWHRRLRLPKLVLFGFPALFALALIPMYPPTASDLIHYHGAARVLWIHGYNPLTVPPEAFPYPIWFYWQWQPSPYGPVWSLLSGLATWPAQDHFLVALHGFKVIAAASLLACSFLIWRIVGRLWPGNATLAVLIFAWNPFVLYRVVGNGHNDLVMMFFVLAAFEMFLLRRWSAGMVALTLSMLVKYVSVLLVPLFVIYLWQQAGTDPRRRARVLFEAGGLSLLILVVVFAPFWSGLGTLDTLRKQADQLITSSAIMISVWRLGYDEPELHRQILKVLQIWFIALAIPLWWESRRDFPRLIVVSFSVFMLYILLALGWFRPWYLLWPLALAALVPRSWLTVVLLAATFFGSFPDLVEQYRDHWSFLESYRRATLAPILVIWVPLIGAWLAGIWRWNSWSMDVVPAVADAPPRESPPSPEVTRPGAPGQS